MELGRVRGVVVATRSHPSLRGLRTLIVEPDGRAPVVAADAVHAGPGDRVQIVYGREAALAVRDGLCPVDVAIVAIVDADERGAP